MTAVTAPAPVRSLAISLVAFAAGMVTLAAFLLVAGFDVGAALGAMWRGAFGSWDALLSATLVRAVPLLLLGLAFSIGARAGAFNIGMEGQFAAGAIAATWVGVSMNGAPTIVAIPGVLFAGLLAGLLWMVIPVVLRWRFGVTEVITTLLLNFVADAAVSWAVSGPLQEAQGTYPQSDPIALSARLPRILAGARVHWGLILALTLVVILWWLVRRSRIAFALKAVGHGPVAARMVGRQPVNRLMAGALLASGAVAGLGGAVEVSGVSYALYQRLSPGYGFTAIAVALLGRLSPWGVAASAFLFGALEAGSSAMQRDAGIPAVAAQVVQATVIIALVLGTRGRK